jgi:predicted nucleotidyltransferase
MRPTEGFYVKGADGVIFAVKGVIHPDGKIIVVPRYLPSETGDRGSPSARYRKIPASIYKLSMDNWTKLRYTDPYLGLELLAMGERDVRGGYDPLLRLRELRDGALTRLQRACVTLSEQLEGAGVEGASIGVSGSILLGLEKEGSDIDLVVYGYSNAKRSVEEMRRLRGEGGTLPLEGPIPNPMRIPIEIHLAHEMRKALKGRFEFEGGYVKYLIRCIPMEGEYPERYGEARHVDRGSVRAEAEVVDDSFGFTVPTRYSVRAAWPPDAIVVSYSGILCEQALRGERVVISGKIEEKVSEKTGESTTEIVVDMAGHYVYNPRLRYEGA